LQLPVLKPAVSMPAASQDFLKRVEVNTSSWDTTLQELQQQLKP